MDILWEKSLHIIKDKVSQQNFDTWIRPIKISSMEGSNITLNVPNKFFKDWLMENYHAVIKEALTSIAGIDLKVDLQIALDAKKSQSSTRRAGDHQEKTRSPKKSVRSGTNQSLNQHYAFDRFVVGPCNQFAHAASVSVAEQPAKNYNPLFIYGGVGLGKTHL
ncbi:MAG: DnaA/Hda family protein, partial [Deltaproteobacteria bacterium]|nr:DnaA/Hda family protein [Deltaproteobacteria bacterium]